MKAIELGATLYVPATSANVAKFAAGCLPELKSMVVCLEDAIRLDEVGVAMVALRDLLRHFVRMPPMIAVFVRPRDVAMLRRMLRMPGIETIRGFVLPKFSADDAADWLRPLRAENHALMPTIETVDAFDEATLTRIRDQLLPYVDRIPTVRIGGNDLLSLLGTRRSRVGTVYDGPLASVIRTVIGSFAPAGFSISGPVYEHFADLVGLAAEVERDVEHGLLTKTAIHPSQVAPIHACYRPSARDHSEALRILNPSADAVFGSHGSMCEPATHSRWASSVVERARIFGVSDFANDAFHQVSAG